VDIVLITLGKTRWNLADTAAAFVLNVTLNLILIPRLGISGAALAWAVSIFAVNVTALIQVGVSFRFLPFSWLFALVAGLAGVAFGGLPAAATAIFGLNAPVIAASVVAGSVGYLAALYRLRRNLHLEFVIRREHRSSDAVAPPVQRGEDALAGDDA
jgi:O-antigen/teichoic acid export membrane protein